MLLHIIFISAVLITRTTGWVNEWDKPLSFSCPDREHISWVESKHSNWREDRRWDYGCRYASWVSTSCSWSGYINNFDQERFQYECGRNQVVTGWQSYHSNWREDRRWKVRCCGVTEVNEYDCAWTGYANRNDRKLYYFVPEGMAITGVSSKYMNRHEDGIWSFRVCRFESEKACNGLKSICGMPFNKVSFPGTHNSGSYVISFTSCFYQNQDMTIHPQAVQGARFFDVDTKHKSDGRLYSVHDSKFGDELSVLLNDMALFLNSAINSHEVFVIRMSDTYNTNVDRLVEYLRAAFPGNGSRTGINDHYNRTGEWPTMEEAIQQNKRVFVFAQDSLCDANCRREYPFFLSENSLMGDTYRSRSGCDGIRGETREKCEEHSSKTFVLMTHTAYAIYICTWHTAEQCNPHVRQAYNTCLEKRSVVNFIAVDFFEKQGRVVVKTAQYGNRRNA